MKANDAEFERGAVGNLNFQNHSQIILRSLGFDLRETDRRVTFRGIQRADSAIQNHFDAYIGKGNTDCHLVHRSKDSAGIHRLISAYNHLRDGGRGCLRRKKHCQLVRIVV